MSQSCRNAVRDIWEVWKKCGETAGTNAGLLKDRYLEVPLKDDKEKKAQERLHEAIGEAMNNSLELYQLAYDKWYDCLLSTKKEGAFREGTFRTDGRMIIGLGGESVLETGLSLQHAFGTPFIPGSALKGLAAHYCDQICSVSDPGFKLGEEYHRTIFGTTEDSGHIIFYDAWIEPESLVDSLKPDVMTPHHGDYYSKNGEVAPTDCDDPNPIKFLSIVGRFRVVVSCDVAGVDGEKWADFAFNLLSVALRDWGIGGKTNAGYGRLALDNQDERSAQSSASMVDSTIASSGSYEKKTQGQSQPAAKNLKYKKGDTVEVTRIPDPNTKRDKPYFKADDGICGMVAQGAAPSVEMDKKTWLVVSGDMEKEGRYDFAVVGAKKDAGRQAKDQRRRR